ncbi:hypothetical protein VTN00DRAFT_9490 [Thermoascus crustaceus]|uniref:uncharacterized protein n=1 Tax=Thermoascus crustaceus TaxID=5088 RepID=UPI0037422755
MLCLAFNITILIIANKQPTSKWKVQPSVLLAISSAASNGLLRFAMAEGAVIAWWTKAMSGCTVHDLHRYWTTANSIFISIRDIKFFNVMTLACIASVVISIDNPLFQRALTISVEPSRKDMAVSAAIAQQIPEGYTGLLQGNPAFTLSAMSPAFEEVMKGYSSREPMHLHNSGCGTGNCSGTIRAAGFAVDCTGESFPYDFGSVFYDENGNPTGSDYHGPVTGMQDITRVTFSSNFTFMVNRPSNVNFTVTYKDQIPCKSQLQVKRCTFRPATLNYPVSIENGTVGFSSSLSSLGTTPDTIVAAYSIDSIELTYRNSTLGGVYLAASDLFTSQAHISQVNHQWTLNVTGTLAQNYVTHIDSEEACNDTWSDPTDEVISAMQEIMFRTALSAWNESTPLPLYIGLNASNVQTNQTMNTVQTSLEPAFQLHPNYLAAGVVIMVACVAAVASTFHGGGKAAVRCKGSNCELDGLLGLVGDRRLQYGEVRYRGGKMIPPDEQEVEGETVHTRLEMAHPDLTTPPRQGVQYE